MEFNVQELSTKQMQELAELISQKVIDHQDRKRKAIKDNAFHNTNLLLRNYKLLSKYCSIVEEQISEELQTMWNDWRFELDGLLENKAKTAKLMKHVDMALNEFKKQNPDDYELISMKYLLPKNFSDEFIASQKKVDRTTVSRRLKKATTELSVLLFGIDVVVDWL